MPNIYLTRRAAFCAAHRLHSSALSDRENLDFFGKCNHPHGHGHNYVIEVTVHGSIDPKTGVIMNLVDLKKIIDETVLEKVDHKNLNLDVAEFSKLNPTAENMTVVFWNWLSAKLPKGLLYEVKLQETENNTATYRG